MRSASAALLAAGLLLGACGGGGGDSTPPPPVIPPPAGANVMTVTVNGGLCGSANYQNKPCVSVQVCAPGTTTCQTVTDLLLDTGSVGLRVFKQALTIPLTTATLAECIKYIGGTSQWGPVAMADVVLGGEPKVTVPIQIIDATFGTVPASCPGPDTSPAQARFNGILGVGLWPEDCGSGCVGSASNGIYFNCGAGSCPGAAVALANQVQNPVAHLPADNNGVIVKLPAVPPGGASSASGFMLLGIGTQANNGLPGAVVYPTDQVGEIQTVYGGSTVQSFLDTGSNGLFFSSPPAGSAGYVPACTTAGFSSWFCPVDQLGRPITLNLGATNKGTGGSPSGAVAFEVGNTVALINTQNSVFRELGGSLGQNLFDWGLPFFTGKAVAIGIEGRAALGSTGPLYAY